MRTVTSCGSERPGGGSTATSYRHRGAAESADPVLSSSRSLPCLALTSAGACGTGVNPFAELETVDMTMSDTAPASGGVISSRRRPLRSTRIEIGSVVGVMIGGNTVAETASEPLTRWASATAGVMARAAHITVTESHAPESERVSVLHPEWNATSITS